MELKLKKKIQAGNVYFMKIYFSVTIHRIINSVSKPNSQSNLSSQILNNSYSR